MKITWSMKKKEGTQWRLMRMEEIQGRTARQILTAAAGSESVAEFNLSTIGKCYFCGTEELKKRMTTKGKAVTCDAGIRLIDSVHPGLLDEDLGEFLGAAEILPGPEGEQLALSP
jgi:hypothetical protein